MTILTSVQTTLQQTTPNKVSQDAQLNANTFQFILGWLMLIMILVFANKTRIGHVLIYYSLLLIILFILVTEYQRIAPLLGSVQTIGDFTNKKAVA